MSVPAYKRNESKLEFYNNFFKLRKEIIMILMRDFGIKARSYSAELMGNIYNISAEDMSALNNLHEKYGITSYYINKYPEWLINGWRSEILMILNNLGIEINCANSVYVTNMFEYYNRRNHWNNAIGYCLSLMDKLHEIISCIRVSIGAYEVVFDMIEKEIKLIKGIRKSDNKLVNRLSNELPNFNNNFVYNNYPNSPYAANYYLNNNTTIVNDADNNVSVVTDESNQTITQTTGNY